MFYRNIINIIKSFVLLIILLVLDKENVASYCGGFLGSYVLCFVIFF